MCGNNAPRNICHTSAQILQLQGEAMPHTHREGLTLNRVSGLFYVQLQNKPPLSIEKLRKHMYACTYFGISDPSYAA